MAKYRITNITHTLKEFPRGFCLDFDGKFFTPTHYIIVEVPAISEQLQEWIDKKWARLEDAGAALVSKPEETKVSLGVNINEANPTEVEEDELDEFNLADAKEAALPQAEQGHIQSISQVDNKPRAKVTLGSENEHMPADIHSPIPGDRVRNVDDTAAFTVRAPHVYQPGAVVKS
jgi:hypothetical protein